MRSKRFSEKLFNTTVYAVWCDRDRLDKWLLDRFNVTIDRDFFDASTMTLPDGKGYIIWLQDNKDFYALLHESLHLVERSFSDRGLPTDLSPNSEVIAYYQSYWFRTLWRWFGNLKKGTK